MIKDRLECWGYIVYGSYDLKDGHGFLEISPQILVLRLQRVL